MAEVPGNRVVCGRFTKGGGLVWFVSLNWVSLLAQAAAGDYRSWPLGPLSQTQHSLPWTSYYSRPAVDRPSNHRNHLYNKKSHDHHMPHMMSKETVTIIEL